MTVSREGFDAALREACLASYEPKVHGGRDRWRQLVRERPNPVQWDPERDLDLAELPYRSLQLGLSVRAVPAYVDEWTRTIEDVTSLAHAVRDLVRARRGRDAQELLPGVREYPVDEATGRSLGMR